MQPFASINAANAASSSSAHTAVSRISVQISDALPALLLPEGTVPQVAIDPVLAPVPNCKSWFRGVCGLRGTLVPVFDVATACGYPPADMKRSLVLVLDLQHQPVGIVCIQAPQVVQAKTATAAQLPELLQPLADFLEHPQQVDAGVAFEFRFRQWVHSIGQQLPGADRLTDAHIPDSTPRL